MKVGVKFCGGCNPRYDRGAFVNKMFHENQDWQREHAEEGENYDLLLVIGGCPSCCASYEQYSAKRIIKYWDCGNAEV